MLGIRYLKTRPSEYVLLFKGGKVAKQGPGLSFFYHAPSSTLVVVPAESRDTPFIFQESTKDFQNIDIQGQITYRVQDAPKLARMLDFSVHPDGHHLGDGIEKLPVRLTNLIQVILREKLRSYDLREALASAADLVQFATERLQTAPAVEALGLEVLDFSILGINPSPDMAKALEASAREALLKEADDAIYQRRNFALEQERKIKENELQTQIAIEEKNRLIREGQMNIEISVQEKQKEVEAKKAEIQSQKLKSQIQLEEQNKQLVTLRSENTVAAARAHAESTQLQLQALAETSPELLEALIAAQMDPHKYIGRAFDRLAKNADKIGHLNISPELLQSLLKRE